jgi:citrate lyase subunit beta/citryl-CoA lyase
MDTPPLIKSALFVPGDRPERVGKAVNTEASAVIIDLEDAVSPLQKNIAREVAVEKIKAHAGKTLIVRVNHLESGLAKKDIEAVVQKGLFAIMVPKLALPADLMQVDRLVMQAEGKNAVEPGSTRITPLVESALAVENAYALACTQTDCNRLWTLSFGAADFSLDLGVDMTREGRERHYPRARMAVACRAAGLEPPLDTPYMVDLKDLDALEADARAARNLGFGGKMCVHPNQVAVINRVFSPTNEEVMQAEKIIAAFSEAEKQGVGAIQLNGKFIDIALVKKARRILAGAVREPQKETP